MTTTPSASIIIVFVCVRASPDLGSVETWRVMHMSCPHLDLIPDSRAVVERGVSEHYMTYTFNSDRQMSARASVSGYVHRARNYYLWYRHITS